MAKKKKHDSVKFNLQLNELGPDDGNPELIVRAVGPKGETLESSSTRSGDSFVLSAKALESAERVEFSAAPEDGGEGTERAVHSVPMAQMLRVAKADGQLVLSPARWRPLFPFYRCVDGKVCKCWWWPKFVALSKNRAISKVSSSALSLNLPVSVIGKQLELLGPRVLTPIFPATKCKPICEGLVEVYERICCCKIVITPPIIIDLLDRLRLVAETLPEIREPRIPRPIPDPVPPVFEQVSAFVGGTLDESTLNVDSDLAYLENADFESAQTYILARPYLLRWCCSCGDAQYRGSTLLGPDGEFSYCFPSFPFLIYGCHREYSFRVRQIIDGVDTVIYDGLAAGIWFDEGEEITLTTYRPDAVECDHPDLPVPTDAAFAMLERIGGTEAWNLQTPAPAGWNKTASAAYNDGLCFPAASVAAARGKYLNCNWGHVLGLRYLFTEALKGQSAIYYRIRVSPCDNNGNPTGTARYLDSPINWKYYVNLGGYPPTIKIHTAQLNLEDNPSYYKIPYRSDQNWLTNYSHGSLDTRTFGNGRHLVTLELYDAGLTRVVPNNAGDAGGGDSTKAFTYEWWHDPADATNPTTTTNVPWAGLSHMFWWDNRKTEADIVTLYKDTTASGDECQFLSGNGASQFAAGIRAYHPHPWFMHSYRLWWKRGLNGASKTLDSGMSNVSGPALPAVKSASESFETMLNYSPIHPGQTLPVADRNEKCTFSLLLHVDTKTWNGSGVINGLDDDDVASFALDMS